MPPASGSTSGAPPPSPPETCLESLARPLLPPSLDSLLCTPDLRIECLGEQMDAVEQANEDMEDEEYMEPSEFVLFSDFRSRLRRPLYAPESSLPPAADCTVQAAAWDRFSLPLTEVAVSQFKAVNSADVNKGLGRLDSDRAFSIARRVCVTSPSLVLALVYLERMRKSNPKYLSTVSSTDIFLISLMVSSKFLHDDGEDDEVFNEDWADAGQITTQDINKLEIDFLCALDWSLLVSPDDFEGMTARLEAAVARNEVGKRGWATYSDMTVLIGNVELAGMWQTLMECAWKITALCAATYAAQLMTLLGTVYVLNKTPLGPQNVGQLYASSSSPAHAHSAPSNSTHGDGGTAFPSMDSILLQESELASATAVTASANKSSFNLFPSDDEEDAKDGHLDHAFTHHETEQRDFLLRMRHTPSQLLVPLSQTLNGQPPPVEERGLSVHAMLGKYLNLPLVEKENSGFCPVRDGFLRQVGSLWANQGLMKSMIMV